MTTIKGLNRRLAKIELQLAENEQGPVSAFFVLVPDTPENADVPTLSERVGKMRRRPDRLIVIPDNGRGDQDPRLFARQNPKEESGAGEAAENAPA